MGDFETGFWGGFGGIGVELCTFWGGVEGARRGGVAPGIGQVSPGEYIRGLLRSEVRLRGLGGGGADVTGVF